MGLSFKAISSQENGYKTAGKDDIISRSDCGSDEQGVTVYI